MNYLLCILFLLSTTLCLGQISHEGTPVEWGHKPAVLNLELQQRPIVAPLKAYELSDKLPLRFAEPIYTSLTPQNSGQWIKLGKQHIWRLAIKSEGAKSINLIFDRFHLKHGDKLFVYNPDKTHVLGAFTNKNNNPSKLFSIAPVLGDEIIIELQTNASPYDQHELLISAVNHDYLGIVDYLKRSIDFNDSGSCNVNVKCGTYNSEEINRSVCKIIVDGSMLCSGTLLNNTFENGKPYFLTAAHCFDDFDISSGSISAQNIIFYFNFDSPTCEPTSMGIVDQTISGADVVAFVEDMDFALLEMNKMPPESYNPYWAGWKRDVSITNKVFGVHHPQGDVKKVSVSKNDPISTTFNHTKFKGDGSKVVFRSDVHWKISEWESGVTEGGSSGSGLFTEDQFLIGSLSGGEAYCGNPFNDYYTRLNKAWDLNSNEDEQLAAWLDRAGIDSNKQDGIDFYSNKEVLTHYSQVNDDLLINRGESFFGTYSGHNSLGYDGYAELYDEYSSVKIAGVYLSPTQVDSESNDQSFNIKIWNDLDGKPNQVKGEIDDIKLNKISTAKQLFTFEEPLELEGAFYVGVELSYSSEPVDTLAIYQVEPSGQVLTKNSAFIRDNGVWYAYNELHPSGENGSYLIELLAYEDYVPTDTGDIDNERYVVKVLNNPVRNGMIEFTSNISEPTKVEVYGLNGSKLREHQILNSQSGSFNVQGLPGGIYLLKFSTSNTSIVKKVFVLE